MGVGRVHCDLRQFTGHRFGKGSRIAQAPETEAMNRWSDCDNYQHKSERRIPPAVCGRVED